MSIGSRDRAAAWQRGRALMAQGRLTAAIAILETLLDPGRGTVEGQLPCSPTALHDALAICHFRLGNHVDAERHYARAAQCSPEPHQYQIKRRLAAQLGRNRSAGEAAPRRLANGPLILIHDDFPGDLSSPIDCPCRYEVTRDRGRAAEADAIVYHVPSLPGPKRIARRPGQLAVAISMESEVLYPLLLEPAFMAQFDVTMTYRRDATIWCAYFKPRDVVAMRRPPQPKTEAAPVVCFVSNTGRTAYDRDGYLLELMRLLAIDSYGRALDNRTLTEDRGRATKLAVCARYKFTIAFENSISQDYVTEKFFDPLVVGSVPVYLGAPNIDAFAPADRCYIDAAAFDDPRALAAHLHEISRDELAYESYLAWRRRPLRRGFLASAEMQRHDGLCRLAQHLQHHRRQESHAPRR